MEFNWRSSLFILLVTVVRLSDGGLDPTNSYRHGRRVIETNHGRVQGLLVEFPNNKKVRPVEVYLGLQYASLLGSRLRFMPPTNPVEKWNGLRMLMTKRPACPQKRLDKEELKKTNSEYIAEHLNRISKFTRHQIEDCLSLNIYVPTKDDNDTTLFPVMVFIHGESYDTGTGNAYDGSVLASYGRVIVITLNYRLGVLGYLTAGDNTNIASGNYALLDIIAALHWVKENIANFTGDAGKVTLFGHGYGAALVNLLLVSPLTKDGKLFQRGILQSGSALSSWAVADDPVKCTKRLAESVNCSQHMNNAQALVSCLRRLSTDELVQIAPESPKYFNCFAPSVSTRSSVIPHPVELLHRNPNSVFSQGSLMFGLTKNEAVSSFTEEEAEQGLSALRKAQIIRTYVHNTFKYHRQKIYEILDHHYTEWDRSINNLTRRNAVMELLTDGQYVAPLVKVGNYHEGNAGTFFYSFSYSSKGESHRRWSGGVHGEELSYVFGAPLVGGIDPFQVTEYSKPERQLSEAMITYWTNFAKTGDPNLQTLENTVSHTGKPHGKFKHIQWLDYTKQNQTFLQISMRPKLGTHYRGRQLALWLDLIPKLHKPDGADPKQHLLKDYHNMTTFDSPEKLLHIDNFFPPPTTTPDRSLQTVIMGDTEGTTDILDIGALSGVTRDNVQQEVTLSSPTHQSIDGGNVSSTGGFIMGDHSVQVSITIAVGCSLLFLNILIFAGIYYQRERIKKLKKSTTEPEGLRLNRKPEEENGRGNGPETISLLSTPVPGSTQVPHLKGDPDCGCSPPTLKSTSTYVPMHKLPSFSTSQPKPSVTIGPNSRGPLPSRPQSNHRLGTQVSVHTKPIDHMDSNSAVTIV